MAKSSKVAKQRMVITVLLVVLSLFIGSMFMNFSIPGMETREKNATNDITLINDNVGDASTLVINSFTGVWGEQGAKTEVYPSYTVLKEDQAGDVVIVNDVGANSTTNLVVGDVVKVYGTGATYYLDAIVNKEIKSVQETVELEAYSVVATTDLVITVYDSNSDVLTADDNANNTADYNGGNVLANDNEIYYFKLEQTGQNVNYQFCGICTYIVGDEADDYEVDQSGWKEGAIPETLKDTTVFGVDDTSTNTTNKGFEHCYYADTAIMLSENDDTGNIKTIFSSDATTQPTANGDTFFGAVLLDCSYSTDKNGNIVFDAFMDDDTEDPGTVGLDENADVNFDGLDIAFSVEPQ